MCGDAGMIPQSGFPQLSDLGPMPPNVDRQVGTIVPASWQLRAPNRPALRPGQ